MKKIILLIIMFCSGSAAVAQHSHNEEENSKPIFKSTPQHGGEVIDAGKYKLEIILNPMSIEEKLIVYILKRNSKEVQPKELTGSVVLKFREGKADTVNLMADKGRLHAASINLSSKANMIFNLNINGKKVSGVYFNNGIIKN